MRNVIKNTLSFKKLKKKVKLRVWHLQSSWWRECKGFGLRCVSGRCGHRTRPDNTRSHTLRYARLKRSKIRVTRVKIKASVSSSYLIFAGQVGSDSSGSLLNNWVHQQVSSWGRIKMTSGEVATISKHACLTGTTGFRVLSSFVILTQWSTTQTGTAAQIF